MSTVLKIELDKDPEFEAMTLTEQASMKHLANAFVKSRTALYMDAADLIELFDMGNEENWDTFLQLKSVKAYCSKALLSGKDVQRRKLLGNLMKSSKEGNAQASKAATEILQEYEKKNDRTIILHYIPRPDRTPPETEEEKKDETTQ